MKKLVLKYALLIVLLICNLNLWGQEIPESLNKAQGFCRSIGAEYAIPTINYEPVVPEKFWKKGLLTELGFSQVSLTNWAAGGSGSISMNAYFNGHMDYAKGGMFWENRLQVGYGFVQSFDEGYRKSDDKFIIDSKWGYRGFGKFYFSATLNFRSQFTPGYEYPSGGRVKVSDIFAPAYFTFGLGLDYKPWDGKILSINFAPLSTSWTIVSDSLLRAKYGNAPDEAIRYSLGASLVANFEKEIFKNCKVSSKLSLFSDYLDHPLNLVVNWDFHLLYKINKFLTTSFRTNLIYDEDILIEDSKGNVSPRVQFKEILSINFAYTFGQFKK